MSRSRFPRSAACIGLLSLVAVTAAQSPLSASAGPAGVVPVQKPVGEFVPNEILVKPLDRVSDRELLAARRRVGGTTVKSFPGLGIEVWRLADGVPVGQAIAELQREFGGSIEFVEPNWYLFAHETQMPDDPRLADLWGLLNVGQTGGTADADIDAPEAWWVTTGSETDPIVVGVIDTGADYLHEDLWKNIWENPAEKYGQVGVDDDVNGYIDDLRGWDFVNGDNDPMDDNGHGTHTSGTIGAVGDNAIGVAGVNWVVRIMPLKFLNSGGWGTTDDAIEAIVYATGFGVRITNNSWGGGRKSRALEAAIRDSGSLFVASAGNSGVSRREYPAGYALDNILSVAATDHDDQLAGFSNYGASWVDLAAPGVGILSTSPGDEYDWSDGTSMAAPHVAGVAALVMAAEASWTWVEVKERILTSVDPLPWLSDRLLTGGRLNAAAALGVVEPPGSDETPPSAVTDLAVDSVATAYDTVGLTWSAPGDDGEVGTALLYDVRYSTSPIDEVSFETATQAEGEPPPQAADSTETFAVGGLAYETDYYFGLKAVDEAGNVAGLSNVVWAMTGLAPPPESICDNGVDDDLDADVDCADLDCVVAGPPCPPCGNNVCEFGEDCVSCAEDCSIPVASGLCGDGICQEWDGEECESCPEDCNGHLTGKPTGRFCCGGGAYGVECSDDRCSSGGWLCEASRPQGACCGAHPWQPDLETVWTCGIEACTSGPGVDPDLFVISYFYDGAGPYDGLTTLGAGSTYTIHDAPGGWYGYPDVAECRVDCDNGMQAYNHDSVSEDGPGKLGNLVSLDECLIGPSDDTCCSTAIDQGLPGLEYTARCCFMP